MNSTPETKLQSGYDLEVTNLASHLLQHWPTTLPQKLLHWTTFSLGVLGKPKDIKTARTAQHTFKNNRISHDSSLCRCVGEKENSFLLIHSKYNRKKVPKLTKWIGTFVCIQHSTERTQMNEDQCNPFGMKSWLQMNKMQIVWDKYSIRAMSLAPTHGHMHPWHTSNSCSWCNPEGQMLPMQAELRLPLSRLLFTCGLQSGAKQNK